MQVKFRIAEQRKFEQQFKSIINPIWFFLILFRSLSDLSLTANNLDCLPEEIGDLSQLVVLRVDDNRLASLPDSIGRLSRLEELQVRRCARMFHFDIV